MIIGTGIDIVDVNRIAGIYERHGESFLNKVLHPDERVVMPTAATPQANRSIAAFLAARFAAKEAAVKALGTGFTGGIGPRDVRVTSLPSGKPELTLYNAAFEQARHLGVQRIHLSLTHEKTAAAAMVILESA